jgi:hypothetical protein
MAARVPRIGIVGSSNFLIGCQSPRQRSRNGEDETKRLVSDKR